MKSLKVLFLLGALALAACSATKAIDSANSIPEKMDDTNKQITDTNEKIKLTNDQMKGMQDQMVKTNQGIHDQQLSIPLDNLLKPENWVVMSPIPFDMVPYGKKFAEAATPEELIDLTYLWLKRINEGFPARTLKDDGSDAPFAPEVVKKNNDEKMARFVALQIIAAFASKEKVQAIIEKEIIGNGEKSSLNRENTAYAFLMLRAKFIDEILLTNSILATSLSNVGMVEEAIDWAQKFEFIARLKFKDKIGYQIGGFLDPATGEPMADGLQDQLNSDRAVAIWQKIKVSMDLYLKVELQNRSDSPEEDQKNFVRDQERAKKAQETVEAAITNWGT